MRKFTIQCKKGTTSIMEVEVEIIKPLEDASVMWLKPGEYRARILLPKSFHQKIERSVDGKKETVTVPDVWCWHAFYDSLEDAQIQAEYLTTYSFEFDFRKYGTAFTQENISAALSAINVIRI
jgi:hypothetical protein